jgi:uncharacterized protein YjbI with pentapeptide repeats
VPIGGQRVAKPLRLTGATFSGATSWGATFGGKADFQRATFGGEATFWGTFGGEASFIETAFSGEAIFWGATFGGKADFRRATFSGKATFLDTIFSGKADFWGATFGGGVSFIETAFSGWAGFNGVTFSGGTTFTFSGEGDYSYFSEATFGGEADFRGATFSGGVSFRETTFKGICYFTRVTLDEKAEIVFENANLRQTSFLDTNLERIYFRDVEWTRKGRRQVLWDEFPHEGGQPNYEKVAENYRQLVINYEAKRDFDTAEDFHIGEMEMRRKKKRKEAEDEAAKAKSRAMKLLRRCWGANGYYLYRLASNYGTSYFQGLLVLGVLLVLFSGIFLFTGLKPSRVYLERLNTLQVSPQVNLKEHKSLHDINYELCLHTACQRASWQQKVCDFGRTIVFTLSLLTFQKERLYEPANACTQFWICIAVPLMAGQTALVLFAIRRRFKR